MFTKEMLMEDLHKLKLNRQGTLLVHSSYKRIGTVDGGPGTFLDALSDFMKEGLLVLPSHTWEYINKDNPVFDVENSPSNVGILTEKFRQRAEVYRSEHPTHSVAALGEDAETFTEGEYRHVTPCARKSVWGKIVDRDADVLLLGVDLTKNTFIHGIEEWVDVPGRLTEQPEELYSILRTGEKVRVPSYRHCGLSWSMHFWKVEDNLFEEGAMEKGMLAQATVRIIHNKKTTDVLSELLQANPNLFSDNEPLTDE